MAMDPQKRIVFALCVIAFAACVEAVHVFKQPQPKTFDEFVARFHKKYSTAQEREHRHSVFEANMKRVAASGSLTAGVTKFSDLTPEEFSKKHGRLLLEEAPAPATYALSDVNAQGLPREVDYRKEGAVTPVPDEGECGSLICGFGFVTSTEAVNKLVNGKLVPLSAQEAMACAYETCGCYLKRTFDWFLNNQSGRVDTEASFPLNTSACEIAVCDLEDRVQGAVINAVISIPSDETAIQAEVAKTGPVTVAVNAMSSWQTYTGGVMTDCQYGQPDHVATIVGYNMDAPVSYWILKNWWGTDWGEKGYIYLAMGTNQCNMTYEPLTVHVARQ
jgi:C1A family cysteine protease